MSHALVLILWLWFTLVLVLKVFLRCRSSPAPAVCSGSLSWVGWVQINLVGINKTLLCSKVKSTSGHVLILRRLCLVWLGFAFLIPFRTRPTKLREWEKQRLMSLSWDVTWLLKWAGGWVSRHILGFEIGFNSGSKNSWKSSQCIIADILYYLQNKAEEHAYSPI